MFSERLKKSRKEKGMTQSELAAEVGVERSSIGKYETAAIFPSADVLCRLAEALEVTTDYLLGLTDDPTNYDEYDTAAFNQPVWLHILEANDYNMDASIKEYLAFEKAQSADAMAEFSGAPTSTGGVWIPVLGRVAAGVPITATEEVLDYEEITLEMANRGKYFALRVQGDSMEPKISNGDVVIVRQQPDVDSGQIAVVMVNGEDATVKRVVKQPNGIMLVANNPSYQPMFYSNEDIEKLPVRICGRVVELRAKF